MENVMTEFVKNKLMSFLNENTTSVQHTIRREFIMLPTFDTYLLHAYFNRNEEQLKYVCDYNGFRPIRNYNEVYLTSILNFLDLEDFADGVYDFGVNRASGSDNTNIYVVFSFKKLKKNKKQKQFYDIYKNMLLDTNGLMKYCFDVENRNLTIKISLTDK